MIDAMRRRGTTAPHGLRFSVALLLQGVMLALVLALVGTLASEIVATWREVGAADRLVRLTALDRRLFSAMQAMRAERGDVQTALLALDAPLPKADAVKAAAATEVEAALASAAAQGVVSDDAAAGIRGRLAVAETRWRDIVGLAALPRNQRAVEATGPWYRAVADVIDDFIGLLRLTAGEVRASDAPAGELATAQQLAWQFRMVAGDECSLMRGAVASGAPLSLANWRKAENVRGAQAQIGASIAEATARRGADPRLLAAVESAKTAFAASRAARDRVYETLDDPAAAKPTAAAWTELCDTPFRPILSIAETALDLMARHAEDRSAAAWRRIGLTGAALLAALAFSGWAALMVRRRVTQPIALLTGLIRQYSQRDFRAPVPPPSREDEFAVMGRTLEMLRLGAIEADRLAASHAADQRAALDRASKLSELCQRFESTTAGTLDVVRGAIAGMTSAADAVAEAALSAGAQTATIAGAVQQTAADIDTVARTVSEMKGVTSDIAQQVARSALLSGEAVNEVRTTTSGVERLSAAAKEIGAVVDSIEAIAARTNLLALNATIEAARAGDSGKGFAVVAGEVKALANQTVQATRQIGDQVQRIRTATTEAVASIVCIDRRIGEIDQIAATIAGAVQQQDASIGQLAADAGAISHSSMEISARLAELRDVAGSTAEEAGAASHRAGDAARHSQALTAQIEGFVGDIGAQRQAA